MTSRNNRSTQNEETKQFTTVQKSSEKKDETMKSKKKGNPNRKKASKLTNAFAIFLGTMASGFVIGVVIASLFIVSTVASAPKIDANTFEKNNSTIVLDADNNVIYDLGEKLIENVEYDEISQSLIDAFIAIEDSRFFEHNGFDIPRFANALIENIIGSLTSFSLSFDAGGASTIDMQLIKNVVFTHEDTETGESVLPESSGLGGIKRKINEIYLSTKMNSDKVLDKKVILQKYINLINFGAGGNTLGVQKASKYYFDKSASELSLIESAFLAGVVNAPNAYTPYNSINLATERTHSVLRLMKFHGYITQEELDLALSVPLENLFVEQLRNRSDAFANQAYIDIVLDEVEELTGLNPATNSMIIKTAMNPTLQAEYDKAQNREIAYLNIQSVHDTEMQLAATVIDNHTGEIIASFGGYDYYGQRIFNRSYHGLYQPGSTAKPLISYAPAFEYLGYATSHVLTDEPYTWAGTDTPLHNWSRKYYGQVSIVRAVASSYNIPAVKTFDEVEAHIGLDRYRDYAEAIGFTRYADKLDEYYANIGETSKKGRDAFNSQFSIGGSNFYTNTTELAGATAAIMNGGDYIKPHTIREVEILDGQGEIIKSPHKKTPVLSEGAAFLTAYLMRSVIDTNRGGFVEGHVARSYPVYAKTGTSNWEKGPASEYNVPSGSGKDRLLLTATDRFSIASWSGFDSDYIQKKTGKAYHSEALKSFNIQARINSYTLDVLARLYGPGVAIKQPSSVTQIKHILGTFPYQEPIAGMNPDLVTTGYVKSENASLAPATPPELEAFQGATVKVSQDASLAYVDVIFKDYPDVEKLVKAPTELETGGSRLYDPSWIFGPVRYTSQVFVDDKLVETIKSQENTQAIRVDVANGKTLRVCTYYSFELNDDVISKKQCDEQKLEEGKIKVSSFKGDYYSSVQAFAIKYGINLNYQFTSTSHKVKDFLRVNYVAGQPKNGVATATELNGSSWDAELVDLVIEKGRFGNYSAAELCDSLSPYAHIIIEGSSDKIIDIKVNGNSINQLKMSDYYNNNSTITLITES